jgi:dienelactone hydrolase
MESKGIKEYFGIGFCWGVWSAFKLATKYEGFKAIAGPHPSLGAESKFYGGN